MYPKKYYENNRNTILSEVNKIESDDLVIREITSGSGIVVNDVQLESMEETKLILKLSDEVTTNTQNAEGIITEKIENAISKNQKKDESLFTRITEAFSFDPTDNDKELSEFEVETTGEVQVVDIKDNNLTSDILNDLNSDPEIDYVQVDHPVVLFANKSTELQSQWFINNDFGIDSGLQNAWDISQGEDILVGVIDTGVDIDHEALYENIFVNSKEIPNNGVDDDGNGYVDDVSGWDFANDDSTVMDDISGDRHGTQVTSMVAAVSPKSKIVPLKAISNGIGYTSDIIEAIHYAEKIGVDIVNCSFGSYNDNPALYDAISQSNMLFVVAAGNDGAPLEMMKVVPASYELDNLITIGSHDSEGGFSATTNYGTGVDAYAPGVQVTTATPQHSYKVTSGTSISCGIASGITALGMSKNPDLSSKEVKIHSITFGLFE